MNRKQKIIVSITGIFIVLLTLVGLTYAYFLTQITGNTNPSSIKVTSADLKLEYIEGNGLISAEGVMPNKTLDVKTFKVKNTGTAKVEYTILFENVINTFINESDIRYELKNTTTNETVTGFVRNFLIEGYENQKILANVEIEKDEIHEYELTIRYVDTGKDQSIDMGKKISFRVNIIGKIDNPTMVKAENIYQNYVIAQKTNDEPIEESAATTYVKNALTTAGLDATDTMVFENRAVVGSFVKAINVGAEIGDCINYDSPQRTDEICDWRILGASENGELEAVTKITSTEEGLFSCEINKDATATSTPGYDKGEEQLATCAETFADGNIGLTARSITVEDINRLTGYSPMNVGVKDSYNVGTYYEEGTLREYLNEITFSWGPGQTGTSLFVTSSNGVSIEKFTPPNFYPLNEAVYNKFDSQPRTFTYTRDYYSYYPTTLTSTNDESASVGLSTSSKAYKMLFENTNQDMYEYWLANKYIDIKPTSYEPVINWGMRIVSGKRITGITFWDSKNGMVSGVTGNANVKPVVNISNDMVIEVGETDLTTGLNTYKIRNLG